MRFRSPIPTAALLAAALALASPALCQEKAAAPRVVPPGAPAAGYIVVTAAKTDIYAAPTDDAASIGDAVKGDAFPLAGKQEGWYFVATSDVTHGWIRSSAAATVFYPDYFQPSRVPGYEAPPPAYPNNPNYQGAPMYPGYPEGAMYPYRPYAPYWGPGWRDRDDWWPGMDPFWLGTWFLGRGHGWGGHWSGDHDGGRHGDWGRGR
jgi:hypothetical protein